MRGGSCHLSHCSNEQCWGSNDEGQLGLGDTSSPTLSRDIGDEPGEMGRMLPPVDLGGAAPAAVAAGGKHSCALLRGGGVLCWGSNVYGQLGVGHRLPVGGTPASVPPLPVALELPALQVRCGLCTWLRFSTREGGG